MAKTLEEYLNKRRPPPGRSVVFRYGAMSLELGISVDAIEKILSELGGGNGITLTG